MNDRFDSEYLEVGDTFVGGPIEQSYFIGAVMAAGGEVDIHGDTVYIVNLPKKAKAPVSSPPVEKAPEPELSPAEDLAPVEEVVPETKVEVAPEPKTYIKPGPKPKTPEAEKE